MFDLPRILQAQLAPLVAVLESVRSIASGPPSLDLPSADLDASSPISARMLGERLGLQVVEGDPEADLRMPTGSAFDRYSRNAVLRGKRGGRVVEVVHHRLCNLTLLGVEKADDIRIIVRSNATLPRFECGPRSMLPMTSLPAAVSGDSRFDSSAWLRTDDIDAVRSVVPFLGELVRLSCVRVECSGASITVTPVAGADMHLWYGAYMLARLEAICDALEHANGARRISTSAMSSAAPAMDQWTERLEEDDGVQQRDDSIDPELGATHAAYRQRWGISRYELVGALFVFASFLGSLGAIGRGDLGGAIVCVCFALLSGAVASALAWAERLERIILRERGFEWRRVLRAPVRVRYDDVVVHHRAKLIERRHGIAEWDPQLVLELRGDRRIALATAPGRLALAMRLDQWAEARQARLAP